MNSKFAELSVLPAHAPVRLEYRWLNAELHKAPVAIFLHEGLGSVAMWKDWPQTLCHRLGMRGLLYSRPGYGRSTPRPLDIRWPIDFMSVQACDVLPALLDSLDLDAAERSRMWLIGHSDGGTIALLYAAAFPSALAGAVVIAPHVFVEDLSINSIAQAKAAYETSDLRTKLSRYHDDTDSAFYGWNDIWLSPSFRAWNIVEQLALLRCPLLAIQAADDQYGTMAQVETIAECVPGTKLVRLPRGGHSPHRETPHVLDEAIEEFIRDSH